METKETKETESVSMAESINSEQPSNDIMESAVEQDLPEPKSPKKQQSRADRLAELESKIERLEAASKLNRDEVVDFEVAVDLLVKGYSVEELRKSKPYLFKRSGDSQHEGQGELPSGIITQSGTVKQPQRVISPVQPPAQKVKQDSGEGFVNTLAKMLASKF